MKDQDKNNKESQYLPICMCLGAGVGLLFGITIFDNISTGMCIGVAVGVVIGITLDNNKKKKS
jgi:hypothetical protein